MLVLLISGWLSQPAAAQGPGSGGPVPGPAPDPTAVPIDGGASALLAAAGLLGYRQLRRR
ncbi:PID-CTERM protein-sorting domain-containing protein [Hymenobacter sp. CRA2]|uniref:PID-CTERM protein-sorting domain-containing protein n=1 Tax=Hymenobacter sp. CRA2 TaxID=1955620 RepID=UPI00098FF23B|nr:MYXO-CTERM sorting domain-containing protein [Hymenobacter sp. CRA2]OON65811.1 hypothetical protein B0919_23260 [Hymenobacter sp. CRA2]